MTVLLVFLVAVAVGCGRAPGAAGGESGIEGTVVSGPHCPVERADSPCPDTPIAASVDVTTSSGRPVASVRAGDDGRFSVGVPPGRYVIAALSRPDRRPSKPVSVTVREGSFAHVAVLVDTGIR